MKYLLSIFLALLVTVLSAQDRTLPPLDSLPNRLPVLLPADIFIPAARLAGLVPWHAGPISRPVFEIHPDFGFDSSIGFGKYSIVHPDKFFSTLEGYNSIDIPHMYITRQMMIGNTFRLAKGFYMLSGILYGTQMGVVGNSWGIGNREGFIWHPSDMVAITLWNQYYQSLSVYFPIVYPGTDGTAVRMPATPEVFSFGVQASIVSGRFIIEVGTSVTPKAPKPVKSP